MDSKKAEGFTEKEAAGLMLVGIVLLAGIALCLAVGFMFGAGFGFLALAGGLALLLAAFRRAAKDIYGKGGTHDD